VHDPATFAALAAERAAVRVLGATCHTPVGIHASGGTIRGFAGLPDGSAWVADEVAGEDGEEPARRLTGGEDGEALARRMIGREDGEEPARRMIGREDGEALARRMIAAGARELLLQAEAMA
jgi:porphobilinogen deaminase